MDMQYFFVASEWTKHHFCCPLVEVHQKNVLLFATATNCTNVLQYPPPKFLDPKCDAVMHNCQKWFAYLVDLNEATDLHSLFEDWPLFAHFTQRKRL